jgi:hypothetical protein
MPNALYPLAEHAKTARIKRPLCAWHQMLMHNRLVTAVTKQPFCAAVLNTLQLPVLCALYFVNKK